MSEWYHSGIEGYCKAAADLLGNRRDGDSVLGLCRDLFPDRVTGTNLAHAWTLSSQRVGDRRCRQKVFETLWLNSIGVDVYRTEAEMLASGELTESGFKTIVKGSAYEAALRACKDEKERSKVAAKQFEARAVRARLYVEEAESFAMNQEVTCEGEGPEDEYRTIPAHSRYREMLRECRDAQELEQVAIGQCEGDAIERCVQRVIDLYQDDEAAEVSYLSLLVGVEDFPVQFFSVVVPSIESGLRSERYRPSDIQRFVQTLNGLVYMAHKCLLAGDAEDDIRPFREFATTLFAGLIYGPNSRLALGLQEATPTIASGELVGYYREEGTTIRLTQVFDDRGAHTGYSELFRPAQVVFFGRSNEAERYLERCDALLSDDPETVALVRSREPVVFPTVLHPAVGRWHGMLLCEDDTWRYYDLDSTNGSSIVSGEDVASVDPLIEVRAGDYLRIGASANVDVRDANAYEDAATLHISSHVDLTEDLV